MGLYESLDEAVGASLLACAPAIGCPAPAGLIARGGAFSARLRQRSEAETVGGVLDAMAREIWLSQDTKGISLTAAEEHALLLPKALEACRPDVQEVAAALNSRGQDALIAPARISSDVIGRAIGAGVLPAGGRYGEICQFLLERTLALLFTDPALLTSLAPAFKAFTAEAATEALPDTASTPARAQPVSQPIAPAAKEPIALNPANGSAVDTDVASGSPLEGIRRRYALSEVAVARLIELLDRRQVPPAQRLEQLEELAAWVASARVHLLQPSNEPQEVRLLNAAAAAALGNADFPTAEQHLTRLRTIAREARRAQERKLREELASLQARQQEEAEAVAGLAELALARHDFDAAIALFDEAAEMLPSTDREGALRFTLWRADCLLRKGRKSGDDGPLRSSALAYAEALKQSHDLRDLRSSALADIGLGQVLMLQAERARDAALLDEAAAAYRRAISCLSREEDAALWAMAHVALGDLATLVGEDRAREAVHAYHAALSAQPRERSPLRWALTQVKLGSSFARLAELEGDRRDWIVAAQAMFSALEVFESEGAEEYVELARRSLRRIHERLPAALAAPTS